MSWEEYGQLADDMRGEYFDGALLMPPAPDRHHQNVVSYLVWQLSTRCRDGEGAVAGWGWAPPGAAEEYIPDVLVHPRTEDQTRFTGIPLLCVEVTSSNRVVDLVLKRAKYAAAGLLDYWIVDRQEQVLITYRLRGEVLEETTRFDGQHVVDVSFAGRSVPIDLGRVFPAGQG